MQRIEINPDAVVTINEITAISMAAVMVCFMSAAIEAMPEAMGDQVASLPAFKAMEGVAAVVCGGRLSGITAPANELFEEILALHPDARKALIEQIIKTDLSRVIDSLQGLLKMASTANADARPAEIPFVMPREPGTAH